MERIRANLASKAIDIDNTSIHVTISIGVASFQKDETELELMARADNALYAAKSAGRNNISIDKTFNS